MALGRSPDARYRHTGVQPENDLQPEKRLMVAVLADAIKCLQDKDRSFNHVKLVEAATEWIMSDRKGHPFCFLELCLALDWDPHEIRQRSLRARV